MLNAKVIHELMKIKGIRSIHELALETKLPYTTLNYMFKGHDMHVSSLIELAHYFKVPIDDLINKYYGFTIFKENETIECPTSNIYEVTLSIMM